MNLMTQKTVTPSPFRLMLAMLSVALAPGAYAAGPDLTARPEVRAFIDRMVAEHDFSRAAITETLARAELRGDIIEAITRPAEAKPWHDYRPIFVTKARIDRGVEFRRDHNDTLARAEETYGVPPRVISAILGVETFYGRHKGGYRVLDSLVTLAFDYPRRGRFFRGELEHYLLLTREERLDPLAIRGSYAGAMGKPQFIASSYRNYAVDFDGDSRKDLWDNTADAIGSIAHYLDRHGWERGQPVASPAQISGTGYRALLDKGLKPHTPLGTLEERYGVSTETGVGDDRLAALIELETESGHEYWVVFNNFYVITRYNHSELYAMAVYQLSQEIHRGYMRTAATSAP